MNTPRPRESPAFRRREEVKSLTGWRAQVLAAMRETIEEHGPEPHVGPADDIWCRGCFAAGAPARWPCPTRVYAERIEETLLHRLIT